MDKVTVAFIGCGDMANQVHYPSLASFSDVEIVALCDIDTEKLNATGDKYGISNRYTNYQKMIEETSPSAVYAIGQPHVMYDVWMWCLKRGLNLYIEKPMGITLHQARALAYMAEKQGCITQVGFQRRVAPLLVQLKEQCLKHGPVVHAVCEFYKYSSQPYLEARDHMMDDGVHALDTLRWICGGEVQKILSVTRSISVPDINFISAILEFDNGSTGIMINSWTSGKRIFRVQIHAPGIWAEADPEDKGHLYQDGDTQGVEYDTKVVAGSDEFFVYAGFQAKNREFIDGLKLKKQPGSNFSDALKTMEVAEKILAKALRED